MNRRIFVENNPTLVTEAETVFKELQNNLKVSSLSSLRMIHIYDLFKLDELLFDQALAVLHSKSRDNLLSEAEVNALIDQSPNFTIESLPGQFDQRADSIEETFHIIGADQATQVSTAILYCFNDDLNQSDFKTIQNYLFNPIDTRLKDLSQAINPTRFEDHRKPQAVPVYHDFIHMDRDKLAEFRLFHGLAMEFADLEHIQRYFKSENRNPTETEILVLDTYWSDHCRHTTFETELLSIDFTQSQFQNQLQTAYESYIDLRTKTKIMDRPETLMDMGTVFGRYQRQTGELADMEITDEVNACSLKIDVDVNGIKEPWLLMFKNETHNHPTEIEPYGGASTCVGGAIRDPLSGRAYVYQAMRITGAADILEPIDNTIDGKLPQRKITKTAAAGNSSYGNQIGSSTTYVKEFYHPGFVAKRMEVGAVVGAVPENQVIRQAPIAGDVVIMLGGKTGRDGVGGATGSSQVQTVETIDTAGSEVQKGSPTEERKILRLFRKPDVTKMIKKSNDFGAGGVSVAIGELADGVDINLDTVPVKYAGLNGTELAISESQERMAVVVSQENAAKFIEEARKENILAVNVATVTENPRLIIRWKGEAIVDISREFLETNGIRKSVTAIVIDSNKPSPLMMRKNSDDVTKIWQETLADYNNASQKGLQSLFDSNLGRSTVLHPYGGKYQATQAESSVQKIQVESGETNTVTILSHGYNPYIGEWSPFHGASYAVIEAVSRVVATGGDWTKIRMSFQEYFERLDNNPERFGKPVSALLGSIDAQKAFNLPSIGGKDSMSGSFNDIDVPPSLIAFAVATATTDQILSPEFKMSGNYIYALPMAEKATSEIDYDGIIANFKRFESLHKTGSINAAIAVREGGIGKALAVMSFGNRLGASIEEISVHDLFRPQYGAFVFTTKQPLDDLNGVISLGITLSEYFIDYGGERILGAMLQTASESCFESVFPIDHKRKLNANPIANGNPIEKTIKSVEPVTALSRSFPVLKETINNPIAYIPVFAGTHGEYDMAKAAEKAGIKSLMIPFRTLDQTMVNDSIHEMVESLNQSHIFLLAAGFATTDEAAGTGTLMATVLNHAAVQTAISAFLERGGLVLGINAGFHALVKTGLLPYGEFRADNDLQIVQNEGLLHITTMINTKTINNQSPWLTELTSGEIHTLAFSAKEGKIVMSDDLAQTLMDNGQIAAQYVDHKGNASMDAAFNPSGSQLAIEAITSPNGQILGKMGHSERYESGLFLNIPGNKFQPLFESAARYFNANKSDN